MYLVLLVEGGVDEALEGEGVTIPRSDGENPVGGLNGLLVELPVVEAVELPEESVLLGARLQNLHRLLLLLRHEKRVGWVWGARCRAK